MCPVCHCCCQALLTFAVTLQLHAGMCFGNESELGSTVMHQLGSVTADTEATIKFAVRPEQLQPQSAAISMAAVGVTALPFQLRIKYINPGGMTCLRVVTQTKPVTAGPHTCGSTRARPVSSLPARKDWHVVFGAM